MKPPCKPLSLYIWIDVNLIHVQWERDWDVVRIDVLLEGEGIYNLSTLAQFGMQSCCRCFAGEAALKHDLSFFCLFGALACYLSLLAHRSLVICAQFGEESHCDLSSIQAWWPLNLIQTDFQFDSNTIVYLIQMQLQFESKVTSQTNCTILTRKCT